mmetsp:Transcript_34706/g.75278  ORF Transcript_34706/g.75278 Transcript_34706/m.75278 type:complete len:533 (-) Transcript_34706:94-1692(-)
MAASPTAAAVAMGVPNNTADNDGEQPQSLSGKALDIFQDTLLAEMTEEDCQLRKNIERLHGPFQDQLSTVRVQLLDKEYTLRLEVGRMVLPDEEETEELAHLVDGEEAVPAEVAFSASTRYQFSIEDADAVPISSIEGPSIMDRIAGGIRGADNGGIPSVTLSPTSPRISVFLGDIRLASLGMHGSFEGGKPIVVPHPQEPGIHRLLLFLSDSILVEGRLSGISSQDLCDGYEHLNQQLRARMFFGAPARFNSENAMFKMEAVTLRMGRGLEETFDIALAQYGPSVSVPHEMLRQVVADATRNDPFRLALEQNRQLKATNGKLQAVRNRLQTIDIRYRSGSVRAKLDQGRVLGAEEAAYPNGEAPLEWFVKLVDSQDDDALVRVPLDDLHTMEITVGGVKVSRTFGLPDVDTSTGQILIAIPFGDGRLTGILDFGGLPDDEHTMQAIAPNFHNRLFSTIQGAQGNFPDEVALTLFTVSFDRRREPIRGILEKLDMSVMNHYWRKLSTKWGTTRNSYSSILNGCCRKSSTFYV